MHPSIYSNTQATLPSSEIHDQNKGFAFVKYKDARSCLLACDNMHGCDTHLCVTPALYLSCSLSLQVYTRSLYIHRRDISKCVTARLLLKMSSSCIEPLCKRGLANHGACPCHPVADPWRQRALVLSLSLFAFSSTPLVSIIKIFYV